MRSLETTLFSALIEKFGLNETINYKKKKFVNTKKSYLSLEKN